MENEFRRRIELRFSLEKQRLDQLERLKTEEREEQKFRDQQMKYLAERDKLEQMSNEKRRRKMLEHKKAIQEYLEQRRIQRAQEIADLQKSYKIDEENEEQRQMLIEEERIKMLKEHAKHLIGFLPPGILKESDREYLPLPPNSNLE